MSDIKIDFAAALADAGLALPTGETIPADGRLHRFNIAGDKPGRRNGWAVLYADGVPHGIAGSWRTGQRIVWTPAGERQSVVDKQGYREIRRMREAERAVTAKAVAEKARCIWANLPPAPADHLYLQSKKISPEGSRVTSAGNLVIPVVNVNSGAITSLQYIAPDGSKRFRAGGAVAGGHLVLGDLGSDGPILVGEGFATMASIRAATGYTAIVAFTAGNLADVAEAIRRKDPNRQIIVAADNDLDTPGNPGVTKAAEAARRARARLAVPPAAGDFNDLAIAEGHEAVRTLIDAAEPVVVEKVELPKKPLPSKRETDAEITRLAGLDSIEYDRRRTAAAKRLGVRAPVLDGEVQRAREKKKRRVKARTQDIVALAKSAKEIINSDAVLDLFIADWRRIVAGEEKNARLLFLVCTSRLFPRTMHAAIKGPSGSGKSEIRQRVLDFFPPEDVISFTTLSEKALLYFDEPFAHKILSMGEAAGTDEQHLQDYLLRELMSAGKIVYPTVQKIGGEITTITIEKDGPVTFLVTTTRHKLNPENETRLLSIEVDDTETQTRSVLNKIAEIEGLNATEARVDFGRWRDFQRWLAAGDVEVVVPFAKALAGEVPPRAVRLRRDLSQVIRAIKAHALLHRNHRERDVDGRIVADVERDYAAVRELMHDLLAETADLKLKDSAAETVRAVETLTADLPADAGATVKQVGALLHLDRSAAQRRLSAARIDGHLVNIEAIKGHPAKYRAADRTADDIEMMPSPARLMAVFCGDEGHSVHTRTCAEKILEKEEVNGVHNAVHTVTDSGVCKPERTPVAHPENGGNLPKIDGVCSCAGVQGRPGTGLAWPWETDDPLNEF